MAWCSSARLRVGDWIHANSTELSSSKVLFLEVAIYSRPLQVTNQKVKQTEAPFKKIYRILYLVLMGQLPYKTESYGVGGSLVTQCAQYSVWHVLLST